MHMATWLTTVQISGLLDVPIHRSHQVCALWVRREPQVKER